MVTWVQVQRKIDRGRGKAGVRVGQPHLVYRVKPGSLAMQWIDPLNLVSELPAFVLRRRIAGSPGLEAPTRMGTLFYELVGNFTNYVVGDLFLQDDTFYGPGATEVDYPTVQINGWVLASHAPVKQTIGARVDRLAQVYRPDSVPEMVEGTTTGYFQSYVLTNTLPLVLTQGAWGLGSQAQTATFLPIGLQSSDRVTGRLLDDVPGMPGKTRWFCYVPPLDGFTFREGDMIQTQEGARYIVFHPYFQMTGLVGSQLVLERVMPENA